MWSFGTTLCAEGKQQNFKVWTEVCSQNWFQLSKYTCCLFVMLWPKHPFHKCDLSTEIIKYKIVRLQCNVVAGSYSNGDRVHVLFEFNIDVWLVLVIARPFKNVIAVSINLSPINFAHANINSLGVFIKSTVFPYERCIVLLIWRRRLDFQVYDSYSNFQRHTIFVRTSLSIRC